MRAALRGAPARARAFSLIEVMIAVLVLALGLLGLGAVIPVIIRDQQQSTAAVRAVSAANDCEAALRNRPDLNRASVQVWIPMRREHAYVPVGWGAWLENHRLARPPTIYASDCEWVIPSDTELDPRSGEYSFRDPRFPQWTEIKIPVSARLWPAGEAEVVEPLFIYDFVARRLPTGPSQPAHVEVALFVRRIDPNIKTPSGTLRELLTGVGGSGSPPMPVAVSSNAPGQRRPTLNGTGEYAKPFRLDIVYDRRYRARLRVPLPTGSSERRLAAQVGQRLVDNLGIVHTVAGVDEAQPAGTRSSEIWLRLESPVPEWVRSTNEDSPPVNPRDPLEVRAFDPRLRHVILTPQVPAAARVFTIPVTDPDESWTGSGAGNQPTGGAQ